MMHSLILFCVTLSVGRLHMMNLFSLGFEKPVGGNKHHTGKKTRRSRSAFRVHLEVSQDLFGDWVVLATKRSNARRQICLSHAVVPQKRMAQEAVRSFLDHTLNQHTMINARCIYLDYHENENLFSWVPSHFPLERLNITEIQ